MSNPFSDFTNQYSLSKTLRFELKPEGKTQDMLKENNIFQSDESRKKAYELTKPYFDQLHREFIKESLEKAELSKLIEYSVAFKKFKTDKKNKSTQKELDKLRQDLRGEVVGYFDLMGKKWAISRYANLKIKKTDLNILFEEQVFQILKVCYGDMPETLLPDEQTGKSFSIFDGWKGFTGYFTKFHETRKNFYKSDGTSTALATRIVDQNLDRFLDNLEIYQAIKDRLDLIEVEKFFKLSATEVFSVSYYNSCLLQEGIDIYNDFIGGKTLENGQKIKGVNEIINKYRQDNPAEKPPFLKKLDKQILSEKDKFIDEIESPEGFLGVLKKFHISSESKTKILRELLQDFFENTANYDLRGIYVSKAAFNTISNKWTAETDIFNTHLYEVLKKDKIVSSSARKKDGQYSFPDFIAIDYIRQALDNVADDTKFWKERYYDSKDSNSVLTGSEAKWEGFLKIFQFEFYSHFERVVVDKESGKQHREGYDIFKKDIEALLKDFEINKDSKIIIKNFADQILYIYQMSKYFALEKKRAWDTNYDDSLDQFYTDPNKGYLKFYQEAYQEIVQPYNKIRNYLTKKPYSDKKWKLNFDKGKLMEGWPDSPEGNTQYCSFIFRKDEKYFLGVTDLPRILDINRFPEAYNDTTEFYEKMVYKQIDAKTLYGSTYIGIFGSKYSVDKGKLNDLDLIKRMEAVLETKVESVSALSEVLKKVKQGKFRKAKDLAREISDGSFYSISFVPVSSRYIEKGVYETGRSKREDVGKSNLYLFKIHNKDWNLKDGKKKIGTKNLHTVYFEQLFSKVNREKDYIFKLNGQAEIFFRPKTSSDKLGTRNDKKGRRVIKRKRYSEDKILFHMPITLNKASENPGKYYSNKYNIKINNLLINNPDINIIGIDRGEKHLAYYSVINQKSTILDSGSLNVVSKVDYHDKLETKAKEREQARKDWQDVEAIKDLKKGYISQVVRKLADLAIKHNAIIVMEDLNMRFKQIRGGIEKSTYQQLEKALIEKLNFLVNKGEVDPMKAGNLFKAYQLTAPFETFKDMGKQTGIIFYTQASYTSKIDPLTGWRPNIYLKYSNAKSAREDILKFTDIRYNSKVDRFEFVYDIKNFINAKEFSEKTVWVVCSNVERFRWDRKLNNNKGGYTHYKNITDNFKTLFDEFGIDYKNNILKQIENLGLKDNEKFFKSFIFYFGLICQIRNTQEDKDGDENDFIFSPVEPFFDSRKAKEFGENLPQNGDDNGAYNIARKGIIILDKISSYHKQKGNIENLNWGDLYVSHTEWDNFSCKHI